MILYALHCACGHEFEQWFENMADYDARIADMPCPTCGATTLRKAIMAPRVAKSAPAAPSHACNPASCGNPGCPMAQFQ
jgi:hypothetical protein